MSRPDVTKRALAVVSPPADSRPGGFFVVELPAQRHVYAHPAGLVKRTALPVPSEGKPDAPASTDPLNATSEYSEWLCSVPIRVSSIYISESDCSLSSSCVGANDSSYTPVWCRCCRVTAPLVVLIGAMILTASYLTWYLDHCVSPIVEYCGFQVGQASNYDDNRSTQSEHVLWYESEQSEDMLPTAEEFMQNFVLPRRPVAFRLGSALDRQLGWKTDRWDIGAPLPISSRDNKNTRNYLLHAVGIDTTVVAEKLGGLNYPDHQLPDPAWASFGRSSQHIRMRWIDMLAYVRPDNGEDDNTGHNQTAKARYYLNLQDPDFVHGNAGSLDRLSTQPNDDQERLLRGPLAGQLSRDFALPNFAAGMPLLKVNLWLGKAMAGNGSKSRLHYDDYDNVYVLLRGRKVVELFDPASAAAMYTYGPVRHVHPNGQHELGPAIDGRQPHFSQLDLNEMFSDNSSQAGKIEALRHKFPLFGQRKAARVELMPGDLLFIPAGWFHEVTSYGSHMALNFWSSPPSDDLVIAHAQYVANVDNTQAQLQQKRQGCNYPSDGVDQQNGFLSEALLHLKREWYAWGRQSLLARGLEFVGSRIASALPKTGRWYRWKHAVAQPDQALYEFWQWLHSTDEHSSSSVGTKVPQEF